MSTTYNEAIGNLIIPRARIAYGRHIVDELERKASECDFQKMFPEKKQFLIDTCDEDYYDMYHDICDAEMCYSLDDSTEIEYVDSVELTEVIIVPESPFDSIIASSDTSPFWGTYSPNNTPISQDDIVMETSMFPRFGKHDGKWCQMI